MNEIQNIDNLTAEILILKQQTAQNIIEIGKRLIAVKKTLPHGEWGKWLSEKVDFTDRTAQRFMKVANEFSNATTLSDLPKSKVFALLDLPKEEREEFVKENPVDEMTTKELQQAIKEKKALENKLKKAEKEKQAAEKEKAKARIEMEVIQGQNKEALKNKQEEIEKLNTYIEDIQEQLKTAESSGDSEEVEKLQVSLNSKEIELVDLQKKIETLEQQLKEKPIEVVASPEIIEKIPEEVERELCELREKIKNIPQTNGNENLIKFKVHFDKTVASVKDLLGVLNEIKEVSEEDYLKYKKAAAGLITKISERL